MKPAVLILVALLLACSPVDDEDDLPNRDFSALHAVESPGRWVVDCRSVDHWGASVQVILRDGSSIYPCEERLPIAGHRP